MTRDIVNKRNTICSFYESRLSFGKSRLIKNDWQSEEAQFSRFSTLVECIELTEKRILDVGCGPGNLYRFLKSINEPVEYCGVDLSEKVIDYARKLSPGVKFECADIFFTPDVYKENSFDIVYSSGIFNLDLGNNREFMRKALSTFYSISKKYIIFNVLSWMTEKKDNRFCYYTPMEIKDILSSFVFRETRLIEDYLVNDFTVICEK